MALVAGTLGPLRPAPVDAASHACECVEYIKNYYGLKGAAGNAKDMGPFLASHGFRRRDEPAVGAVVILQPSFYKSGDGAIYGHVAIIESTAPAGKTGWFLGLRGGNQTGARFTASGCSNVTFKSYGPISRNSHIASFWLPPAAR